MYVAMSYGYEGNHIGIYSLGEGLDRIRPSVMYSAYDQSHKGHHSKKRQGHIDVVGKKSLYSTFIPTFNILEDPKSTSIIASDCNGNIRYIHLDP